MNTIDMASIHDAVLAAANRRSALLGGPEFAELLGINRRTFAAWLSAGDVGPAPISNGGHPRWSREEIEIWLRERNGEQQLHTRATWPSVWAVLRKRKGVA